MSAPSQPDPALFTTIDLLRHGICAGEGKFCGSTDFALLPKGIDQMDSAVRRTNGWTRVVSSPLKRCLKFAELISVRNDIQLRVDDRWREIDFGDWDGQEIEKIFSMHPHNVHQFYSHPESFTPPGGESAADTRSRVVEAYNELLNWYRGEHVLVIQHGGTSRLLLTHIFDLPLSSATLFDIPYACLTRIRVYHEDDGNIPVLVAHVPEYIAKSPDCS